ncbi:MAG TPA: hypothetical protein VGD04_05890 [Methylophilus sp.]
MHHWVKQQLYSSTLLSQQAFDQMLEHATVLEQDELGIKVIQLATGEILKIFRVKRLWSGANIFSYARRFYRNASRLQALGIPSIKTEKLYHLENPYETAVLYQPVPGKTIRQLIAAQDTPLALAEALGNFIAQLHRKGVHFHSLHTGNVVLMPDGALGLIDISDLTRYPWPLFCNTRARSFRRLCRYPEDIQKLGFAFWQTLQQHYFQSSQLNKHCELMIKKTILQIGVF